MRIITFSLLLPSLLLVYTPVFAGIFNARVTTVSQDGAIVEWETSSEASTEIRLGQVLSDGSCPKQDLPALSIPDSEVHVYPLDNLTPDTTYCVEVRSFDSEVGEYMACDDGSSPFRFTTLTAVVEVNIDIKPGSDPNCFNINGHGIIPVAILGSAELDVGDIDVDTLSFGGLKVRVRSVKGPLCSMDYSNEDEFVDLVCHFEDDPAKWTPDNDTAELTGELTDGTRIKGTDSICVVP